MSDIANDIEEEIRDILTSKKESKSKADEITILFAVYFSEDKIMLQKLEYFYNRVKTQTTKLKYRAYLQEKDWKDLFTTLIEYVLQADPKAKDTIISKYHRYGFKKDELQRIVDLVLSRATSRPLTPSTPAVNSALVTPVPGVGVDAAKTIVAAKSDKLDELSACMSSDIVFNANSVLETDLIGHIQILQGFCDNEVYKTITNERLDYIDSRLSAIENPGYSWSDAFFDTFCLVLPAIPIGFAGGIVGGVVRNFFTTEKQQKILTLGIVDSVKEATKKSFSLLPNLYKAFNSTDVENYNPSSQFLKTISFTAQYHKCQIHNKKYSEQKMKDLNNQVLSFNERILKYQEGFSKLLSYDIHTAVLASTLISGKILYGKPHSSSFVFFPNLADIIENFGKVEGMPNKSEAEKNLKRINSRISTFYDFTRNINGASLDFKESKIEIDNFKTTASHLGRVSEFIKTIYERELSNESLFSIYVNIVRGKSDNLLCWVIQSTYREKPESEFVNKFWYIAHIGVLNEAYAQEWFKKQNPEYTQPLEIDLLSALEKGNLKEFNTGSTNQLLLRGIWQKFSSIYDKMKVIP